MSRKEYQISQQELENSEQRFRDYQSDIQQQNTCKVCIESDMSIVFLPYGHLCCCNECGSNLAFSECPMGRIRITSRIKIY